MPVAPLKDRACLRLGGTDVRSFLQGIITQDVNLLDQMPALYAALLTAQGKYLFDFFLKLHEDAILLEAEAARLPALRQRLMMYRLRAAVTIEDLSASHRVLAGWGDAPLAEGGFTDPRLSALGWRLATPAAAFATDATAADYDIHRLALGVPDASRDIEIEKTLILEANIDALAGVSFHKGCYVGQELTARMKHRGNIRRRLLPVRVEGTLPASGTAVMKDGRAVGELRSGRNGRAIALIRLEDLDKAPFDADGAIVTPFIPDWLASFI